GGQSCVVNVTYNASGEGVQSATLVINSNDSDEPTVQVSLTGRATVEVPPADITLGANALEFGALYLNETKQLTVNVRNDGGLPLNISGATINGSSAFTATSNCSTLAAGQSCAV